MKLQIELLAGPNHSTPSKRWMQRNIDAQERAIQGKSLSGDFVVLSDTLSILEGIKEQLLDED